MITAEEWEAYNDAVSKISDGAAASVENAVLGWCRRNPNATVAESREAAKLIMEGCLQSYDGLASAFAARWYDHQAESNGINLQNAVTAAVYTPKKTDSVARYQVRKLTREGPSAFAKACGEYARNDALRALNETIIANVGRDKKKGVRFARVPTGRETCTFCTMLASRGAVYHTRKSAGEFKHFHRRCDCKVVPGFEDDPMATLVQGHDPKDMLRQWRRIENKTIVADRLHELSRAEVSNEVDLFDGLARQAKKTGFAELSRTISSSGTVSFEQGSIPKGKELQVAKWLSSVGFDSLFRDDSTHFSADGNTSALLVNDETWDIKRITSSNPGKIAQAIFRKKYQGPNYIIDLSLSDISESEALAKCAAILDDERVSKIALIVSKKLILMKK